MADEKVDIRIQGLTVSRSDMDIHIYDIAARLTPERGQQLYDLLRSWGIPVPPSGRPREP
jgi:hypothetical protein